MEHDDQTPISAQHASQIIAMQTDILAAITEIQAQQNRILAILEEPAREEARRQAAKAESDLQMTQAYASGELGFISG